MRKSLILLPLLMFAQPAAAVDVTFSGTLAGVCTLALSLPGTLALSVDGTRLGSEETGGIPATLTILSIGTNTVTVAAPTRTASPAAYVPTGEVVEIAYNGLAGLAGVTHAYTASSSTFGINTLPLTIVLFNSRITNANGFAAGTFTTRSVVTCS